MKPEKRSIFKTYVHYLRQRVINQKKCKDGGSYFYKNKKYRRLEIEKKNFFNYFISESPNFSYMFFFRKSSIFGQSIPLNLASFIGWEIRALRVPMFDEVAIFCFQRFIVMHISRISCNHELQGCNLIRG